jgi:hypothetical protein
MWLVVINRNVVSYDNDTIKARKKYRDIAVDICHYSSNILKGGIVGISYYMKASLTCLTFLYQFGKCGTNDQRLHYSHTTIMLFLL